SVAGLGRLGELLQDRVPATAAADAVAQRLTLDEPVEVPVLQLDCGLSGTRLAEPDLDLAGVRGIRVELPSPVDLPGDHQPVRRLPGHHPTPAALAAVDAALVPPAALPRLQDGLGDVGRTDVVLGGPPRVERFGEHPERAVDRYADGDRPAQWRDHGFVAHES